MKVRVYFKGLLKGSWIFDFKTKEDFMEYYNSNERNIKDYELL